MQWRTPLDRDALTKLFPFLRWFPISGETFRADFFAGLTVALLLVPQSMAYAQIAELPPQYGLYTAFIPVIVAALFGWCHQLSSGPVAMSSLLFAVILGELADPQQAQSTYLILAVQLGLLIGLIRLTFGLLRLARLVSLIPQPVIVGFINAGALIIGCTQLDKIFGLPPSHKHSLLAEVFDTLMRIPEAHGLTMMITILSFGIVLSLKRFMPKYPGVLVAVILTTLLSWGINLGNDQAPMRVAPVETPDKVMQESLESEKNSVDRIVGDVPPGPPTFKIPEVNLDSMLTMLPGAFLVMLIGFMEMLSVSKAISARTQQRLNLNQELIGQGLANVSGSFFGGYSASGSLSRSALNMMSGAKTGLSAVITGLCVFGLLMFLYVAQILYYLPMATLAVVIMLAVAQLINFEAIKRAWRVSWCDGLPAVITLVVSLVCAPKIYYGILVGTGIAWVLAIVRRHQQSEPEPTEAMPQLFNSLPADTGVISFAGALHFANMSGFEEQVFDVSAKEGVKTIIIDGRAIQNIDASAEQMLRELGDGLALRKVKLMFADLSGLSLAALERSGLKAAWGEERFVSKESEK